MEQQKSIYAPILVMVYDRLGHLQKCIEHLKTNKLACESDLYIVSDAAKDANAFLIVKKIRDYVLSIDGFLSVTLIARETNLGSFLSGLNVIEEIFTKYDRLIGLEDDVLVSASFLEYVNKGLDYFENDPQCYAICGYIWPIELPESYQYDFVKLSNNFSAWGYGVWRNKWVKKQFTQTLMEKYVKDKRARLYFKKHLELADAVMIDFYKSGKIPMDGLIAYQMYLQKEYCVFPLKNLTINIGLDGTGENCSEDVRFSSQELNILLNVDFLNNVYFSKELEKEVCYFFGSFVKKKDSYIVRIKNKFKNLSIATLVNKF